MIQKHILYKDGTFLYVKKDSLNVKESNQQVYTFTSCLLLFLNLASVNIVSLLVLHFSDLSHRENSKAGISNLEPAILLYCSMFAKKRACLFFFLLSFQTLFSPSHSPKELQFIFVSCSKPR